MSTATSLTLLLIFSLAGLILGSYQRIRLWRRGKGECQAPELKALLTIPKRYFVDLHHIVQRDSKAARMHISFAGSLVVLLLLMLVSHFWRVEVMLKPLFSLVVCALAIGTLLLFLRRRNQPSQLSYGQYNWSAPAACLLLVGMLILLWTQYVLLGTILAALALTVFFWSGFFNMPLKHMISGAAHLAYHPRAERFSGQQSTGLKLLDTDTQAGVESISDFSWKQILSFDACIECGRCQQVCPAFESGQPLNPKKLIQDLHLLSTNNNDLSYTGAPHPHKSKNDAQVTGEIADLIDKDTLYACTSCRACVQECPMMIEHVDAIVDMRRHYAMERGDLPEKAVEALVNLRHTDTVGGHDNTQRHAWLADLNLPLAQAEHNYDVLLLCGESVFELRARNTVRQLIQLLQQAGKSVALLADESDVGDLARRLGDEVLFQRLARDMIVRLDAISFTQIITLDPHIYHCINNEYPALGGQYTINHASSYLHQLILQEQLLPVARLEETITYHDPCYLGRYNGVIDAPRQLLSHIGVEVKEMQRSKMQSRCCGWGGGSAFSDIPGDTRIPDMRMDDIRQSGTNTVAVSCPNCMTMLESVVEPRAEVVDLISLVAQAVDLARAGKQA